MNDERTGSVEPVHWSFWTISAIALIWNLMSVLNYFAQMDPDTLAQYSESARSIVEGRPAWATGAFVAGSNFSTSEISMMIVLPLLVAGNLVWYSKLAERKGWVS